MKKLLELEEKLKKARAKLEKSLLGDMNPMSSEMGKMDGMDGMDASAADVNTATKSDDEEKEDKKKDKKQIQKEIDKHNEKKHGEAKNVDSAMKADIPKDITDQPTSEILNDWEKPKPVEKGCGEMVKFEKNGQWSIAKASMGQRPNGEFDVPVKDVYNGDDAMDHIGSRSVDGDKPGKNQKESDTEKKLLKD